MHMERRTRPRYAVMPEAVTMVFPKSLISTFVIDISANGLSFAYTGWEDWTDRKTQLLDFFDGETFIERLPVEIVSDIDMGSPDGMPLRRVGVKFQQLSPDQTRLIEHYLSKYAQAEEMPTIH